MSDISVESRFWDNVRIGGETNAVMIFSRSLRQPSYHTPHIRNDYIFPLGKTTRHDESKVESTLCKSGILMLNYRSWQPPTASAPYTRFCRDLLRLTRLTPHDPQTVGPAISIASSESKGLRVLAAVETLFLFGGPYGRLR